MVDSMESNHILGLLENKVHFLEELLTYSKMLAEITYEDHASEYENLLETRERCIETLHSIEEAIQSESRLSAESENIQALKDSEGFTALNARAKELAQEILVIDAQNKAAITAELQNLKMRINALNCGRKGISGYNAGQRVNIAGIYTDSRK
jgi:hypothetical protein